MTPTQLYNLFRSDTRDETSSYLWSDIEVYSYMDDAQKQFCRLSGGIADSTSAITQITVVAGNEFAEYDPRILKLRDMSRASDFRTVEILNFEDLGRPADYTYSMFNGLTKLTDRTGPIVAVVSGMEVNRLRLIDIPEENEVLRAIVYRLPLENITPLSTAFEIDEQHHRHLLHWMKHLGHQKQDAETYDRGRAVEFAAAFYEYCDRSKAERERREHKYRTVAYGGY